MTASDYVEIIIGDEYDEALKQAIREVLKDNDAIEKNYLSSLDLEVLDFYIFGGELRIERETFIGITLIGSHQVTQKFLSKLERKIGLKKKQVVTR